MIIPVEKNKTYPLIIEDVSSDGNGIGHIDGFTVFVAGTVTGDEIECLIVKVRSHFAYGKAVKIVTPSPYRVVPGCMAYKRCGGCQLMHISYEYQKVIKKNIVDNALSRIGGFEGFETEDVIGMDIPKRYRNKMIFPVGKNKDGKTICGFYARRSHDIMEVGDCLLGAEINQSINDTVLEYMAENNVVAYDEESHSGIVRRVFTRVAHTTGDVMVVLSVNADEVPNAKALIAKLTALDKSIKSIILNINKKRTNLVLGEKNITLYGEDTIFDTLLGIRFEISPHSFYQVNPVMTEKLYQKAIEYANLSGNENVMDIYCGIGTISLCVAKDAKKVIGVEIVEAAIENAKENAKNNGITNAHFYADSAENIVPKLIDEGERPDVVIIDPPRKGSDEKTLSAIVKASPKRVVYVSCNPSTLARDARFLCENGYKLDKAMCYDLFPNTVHVETVAKFCIEGMN